MSILVVHVDKGWAWGSVIAGFIANVVMGGLGKSFGLVMTEFQVIFECPSAYMTLAGGLIYSFMFATSIVVHVISAKVGPRIVVAGGALGASLSILGASLAENVALWVLLIGVGVGISLSSIFFSSFVVVGQCFEKRLGLANGISVAGVSVGQVVFPSIVSFCIEEYTIRGATLIAAALISHLLIAAVLMPSKIIRDTKPIQKSTEVPDGGVETTNKEQMMVPPMEWMLFLIFTGAKVFSDVGDVGLSLMFPAMGREIKLSNTDIGYAIACGGVVDFICRLFFGWLSDRKGCPRSLLLCLAWIVEAANGVAMASANGLPTVIACYIIYGGCTGSAMALFIVVLTDFVTVHHLPRSFGIMMLALGIVLSPGQFLLGLIKDLTGTYSWSLRAASMLVLVGALVMLLEYPVRWRRRHRKKYGVMTPQQQELEPMADSVPTQDEP